MNVLTYHWVLPVLQSVPEHQWGRVDQEDPKARRNKLFIYVNESTGHLRGGPDKLTMSPTCPLSPFSPDKPGMP